MQTGYSSAQGQCTGQGGEGGEGGREGEMDSLQPNLEGADRARSSEVCVCVCACVCARSVFVHMYASCVDVSVLHSSAVEVNEQVQVSSVLTCSYR